MASKTVTRDQELADSVITASRVLVAVAARSLAAQEGEISLQQYRALVVLASHGPQRPVDLAQSLGVDPSTATRLCDRLVRKRLISRRRQGDDRREVQLDLTTAGRRLIETVTACRRAEIKRILEAIPAERHQGLIEAFGVFGSAAGELPDDQWQRSWDL